MRFRLPHHILLLASRCHTALAQSTVVSNTAAWSSQIIAFWGAVGLGTRLSTPQKISNPFTALFGLYRILNRTWTISSTLQKGGFVYLSQGLVGGAVRVHVVVICWKNKEDLTRLALRVAMTAEAIARQNWTIVVVGRQLKGNEITEPFSIWTICPRMAEYSTVRHKLSADLVPHIEDEDILSLIRHPAFGIDPVANLLANLHMPATRVALITEVASALQNTSTIARHVTGWQIPETSSPYIHIIKYTGAYATSRTLKVISAFLLYTQVHLAVSVAVGLMAAATGRGLTVWLFSTRVVISQLGGASYAGDDGLFTILAFSGIQLNMATEEGNFLVAGDVLLWSMRIREVVVVLLLNVLEIVIILGGWVYGSLQAQRFPPTGLVGHGMIWLAFCVSIMLGARAMFGLKERVTARIIGIFEVPGQQSFRQHSLHADCALYIPAVADMNNDKYAILSLASEILSSTSDDAVALLSALRLLRSPSFATKVEEFAIEKCMAYVYKDDRLQTRGWKYPWKSFAVCIVLVGLSACASTTYAYVSLPRWFKLCVEVLVSICAVYVSTLERASPLPHLQHSYMSFMVAATVVCSVWYVGVEGVG
ncbi:hypothetical protein GGX14DRAFT_351631 [Mycena pura]|uniref:Uncharacterized protein n=1 Tax=Mycena pura TaxID=153505 RepID=A0AAD6YMB5_9AGAR|nr:hypothetical protein GGX14DRAFT_351631 [Mycena pura]